jgi:predicted acyltransferase
MQVPSKRLLSLDIFRGATVAAMILVNNPGSWGTIYPPLRHADWNGCTPTDLIFPFFLFIVGVSIAYAYGSSRLERDRHPQLIGKALRRAVILFGLGLMLSLFPQVFTDPVAAFEVVRIPGVLQRIAVVFFVSALIFLKSKERSILFIGIGILVAYWLIMTFVPVPGIGPANLGKETNMGAWLDRTLLGEVHLWKSVKTWDPEGILSTLPAIGTCLMGVLAGAYLRRKDVEPGSKVAWLCYYGVLTLLLGWVWSLQFPLNKSLWTSSFVLYTGGLATVFLALLYWIIDVQGRSRYTKFFLVFGVNAITVFFLSGIMARSMGLIRLGDGRSLKEFIYEGYFTPYFSAHNASLAYAAVFVLFWTGVVWLMYNRKIFIKI